jgi:hypothetical protein
MTRCEEDPGADCSLDDGADAMSLTGVEDGSGDKRADDRDPSARVRETEKVVTAMVQAFDSETVQRAFVRLHRAASMIVHLYGAGGQEAARLREQWERELRTEVAASFSLANAIEARGEAGVRGGEKS